MKDRPGNTANSPSLGLFLVSPLLHCVSLTVVVYLRAGFGFAYLRPKSVFFACSWAFLLYAVYAWMDGEAWQTHRALLWFGLVSMALYWFHVLTMLRHEWRESAEHDHFSGESNLRRLPGLGTSLGRWLPEEGTLHLWGEPLVVTMGALFLRMVLGERSLSGWLLLAAFCLWVKEVLNRWLGLRQRKRRKDVLEDAEDAFATQSSANKTALESQKIVARKAKTVRQRDRVGG